MSLLKKPLIISVLVLMPFLSTLAAEPKTYTAPIDLQSHRPVVELTINGEGPFPFVFDTGADQLYIQKSLVDKLALKKTGTGRIGSPLGEGFDADLVLIDQLSVGGATLRSVEALVNTLPPQAMGGSTWGVIGPFAFKEYGRVSFDFKNRRLEIGGSVTEGSETKWINFGKDAPLLDAELFIEGQNIPVHIDTGMPGIVTVPARYANHIPLKSEIRTLGMARTIDREFEIKGAKVDLNLSLGDAQIPLTSLTFFEDMPLGNLGMGALHNLILEIDWEGQRYRLSGIAEPKEMQRRRRPVKQS